MIVKPLTEYYLEFLSFKGGCRGLTESTHVKMPHCWKSHAMAQLFQYFSIVFSAIFVKMKEDDHTCLFHCINSLPTG